MHGPLVNWMQYAIISLATLLDEVVAVRRFRRSAVASRRRLTIFFACPSYPVKAA